jgi:hypothetical protein
MTYIVDSINEWIAAAIAHCQPITAEPYDVDVLVPIMKRELSINHFSVNFNTVAIPLFPYF